MFCSSCGQELAPEAKFCSNCGAPVQAGVSGAQPNESQRERERREDFERAWGGSAESKPSSPESSGQTEPASRESNDSYGDGGFAEKKPDWEIQREQVRGQANDEWAMFDLGPPKARRRRTWLWVLLGLIAFIVIACCVFGWWITATESGTDWFEGIATQAAEEIQRATEESATPVP